MRVLRGLRSPHRFKENIALLRRVSPIAHKRNVLLVAGDIADRIETIAETLSVLRARFCHVFYTPGNHELWVRDGGGDSLEKMRRIVALCDELGIQTRPGKPDEFLVSVRANCRRTTRAQLSHC